MKIIPTTLAKSMANRLGTAEFHRALFSLAIPIMLQNLINSSVNMIDTVMIGRLGTAEIAAVGLANNFFFLMNMILFGAVSGGGVFAAQFWGKKDIAGIRKNFGLCLIIVFAIASLFTGVSLFAPRTILSLYSRDPMVVELGSLYLRTVAPCFIPFGISFVFTLMMRTIEKVKLSMTATFISLSLNVCLNALLIFGLGPFPELGIRGAAIATVIARFVELLILVTTAYARKYAIAGTFRELFAIDARFVSRYFAIAFPVIVNELLWSLGVSMQNLIFARTGTDAFAAFNIVNTLSQLTWVVFIGLGNGCSVLIGKRIGEGREDAARAYSRYITSFAPLMAFCIAFLLLPLSRLVPVLFKVEPAVLGTVSSMIMLLALSYPFRAFNMSMVIGVCRAGGDTVFSVFYDLFFMWTFALPLGAAASFAFGLPAWAVYACIASEDVLKVLPGWLRLRSGKWLHNVT